MCFEIKFFRVQFEVTFFQKNSITEAVYIFIFRYLYFFDTAQTHASLDVGFNLAKQVRHNEDVREQELINLNYKNKLELSEYNAADFDDSEMSIGDAY